MRITWVYEPPRLPPAPNQVTSQYFAPFEEVGRRAGVDIPLVEGFLRDVAPADGFILLDASAHPLMVINECAPEHQGDLASRLIPIDEDRTRILDTLLEPLSYRRQSTRCRTWSGQPRIRPRSERGGCTGGRILASSLERAASSTSQPGTATCTAQRTTVCLTSSPTISPCLRGRPQSRLETRRSAIRGSAEDWRNMGSTCHGDRLSRCRARGRVGTELRRDDAMTRFMSFERLLQECSSTGRRGGRGCAQLDPLTSRVAGVQCFARRAVRVAASSESYAVNCVGVPTNSATRASASRLMTARPGSPSS